MDHFRERPQYGKTFLQTSGQQPAPVRESEVIRERPAMYKVVVLNDDYTPMEFVVLVLRRFFHKAEEEAVRVMLETHHTGKGHCGIYTRDVAETKMTQVVDFARANNYPLKCILCRE